jgi:hypothetical protein
MKRGRKPFNGHGNGNDAAASRPMVKSTYLLDPVLKQNVAYLALSEGLDQSDVVRDAIARYLRLKKLDPASPPKFAHRS